MRADQLLVERGLAASRSQAQRLIASGVQWRLPSHPWQRVEKNGWMLPLHCEIQLIDDAETRYVSRGGLKLEGALATTGVNPLGQICLDLGQSTGGFTDCLLQHGAERVVGMDVGHGQLHPRLQNDPRVVCLEKCHARDLAAPQSPLLAHTPAAGWGVVVADLSFISLTLVLPAIRSVASVRTEVLLLVKPQFELQPADLGKGGLVKDPSLYLRVQDRLTAACGDTDFLLLNWLDSPITGGDGNREFFMHVRRRPT